MEFELNHMPTLFEIAGMEEESSVIFVGRKVDLRTPEDLSCYFRDKVLQEAEVQCVAGWFDSFASCLIRRNEALVYLQSPSRISWLWTPTRVGTGQGNRNHWRGCQKSVRVKSDLVFEVEWILHLCILHAGCFNTNRIGWRHICGLVIKLYKKYFLLRGMMWKKIKWQHG